LMALVATSNFLPSSRPDRQRRPRQSDVPHRDPSADERKWRCSNGRPSRASETTERPPSSNSVASYVNDAAVPRLPSRGLRPARRRQDDPLICGDNPRAPAGEGGEPPGPSTKLVGANFGSQPSARMTAIRHA
jgi:hypothetical protein